MTWTKHYEAFMREGWKDITEEWRARRHRNGFGVSWMHVCAPGKFGHLARRTDAGRVRCKACGKMLPGSAQMLMELQKLGAVRG